MKLGFAHLTFWNQVPSSFADFNLRLSPRKRERSWSYFAECSHWVHVLHDNGMREQSAAFVKVDPEIELS